MICLLSKSLRMGGSLVKLLGIVKYVTKVVTGCLRMTKVAITVILRIKGLLAENKKYGTLSLYSG